MRTIRACSEYCGSKYSVYWMRYNQKCRQQRKQHIPAHDCVECVEYIDYVRVWIRNLHRFASYWSDTDIPHWQVIYTVMNTDRAFHEILDGIFFLAYFVAEIFVEVRAECVQKKLRFIHHVHKIIRLASPKGLYNV